jgi:acyl-CoA reductase-like NAD-dependent aldehyde dehydrogenase
VCANRIYVQDGIHDKFVATMADMMDSELRTGNGLLPDTTFGPLINSKAVQKVRKLGQIDPFLDSVTVTYMYMYIEDVFMDTD